MAFIWILTIHGTLCFWFQVTLYGHCVLKKHYVPPQHICQTLRPKNNIISIFTHMVTKAFSWKHQTAERHKRQTVIKQNQGTYVYCHTFFIFCRLNKIPPNTYLQLGDFSAAWQVCRPICLEAQKYLGTLVLLALQTFLICYGLQRRKKGGLELADTGDALADINIKQANLRDRRIRLTQGWIRTKPGLKKEQVKAKLGIRYKLRLNQD